MNARRGIFIFILVTGFMLLLGEALAGVIPPSNPPIVNISSEITVCEGSTLSQPFSIITFSSPTFVNVSPGDYSVDLPVLTGIGENDLDLRSGVLDSSFVGQRIIDIMATSGLRSSSAETVLNVIATNHAPSIDADAIISKPGIFAFQLPVSDDFNGSFTFNLTGGPKHTTIDDDGIIRAVLSPPGNYTVYVCVKDSGLPSSNGLCASEDLPKVTCKNIILSSVPGWKERIRVVSGSWHN